MEKFSIEVCLSDCKLGYTKPERVRRGLQVAFDIIDSDLSKYIVPNGTLTLRQDGIEVAWGLSKTEIDNGRS